MTERLERLKSEWLDEVMELASRTMRETTPDGSSLLTMADYHLATGGKRLRALLPLAVADAMGADPGRLVPFAAACEVLHNATLVHDDLQDGDRTRRNEPTVWVKWDAARAINLGDAMLYWTIALALRSDIEDGRKTHLVDRIVRSALSVIDGQEKEFALKEQDRPSIDDYFRMVEGKTSGLFALPVAASAEVCGASPALVEALEHAAMQLGVLFQIQDDVLDLYADKGRDVRGSDIGEGKISALVAHFLTEAPDEDATWLRALLRRGRGEVDAADVERVATSFRDHGTLAWVFAEIDRRRRAALENEVLVAHPEVHALIVETAELFLAPIDDVAPPA